MAPAVCSKGWPCQASVGGEALGPVKARCPSVGKCQVGEAGVGRQMREHPHVSREREWDREFQGGTERG